MRIRPWLLWTTLVAQLSAWAAAVLLWNTDNVPMWVTLAVWLLLALALSTWNLRKRHSFWTRIHQWACTASFAAGASALVCLGAIGPSAFTSLGRRR